MSECHEQDFKEWLSSPRSFGLFDGKTPDVKVLMAAAAAAAWKAARGGK